MKKIILITFFFNFAYGKVFYQPSDKLSSSFTKLILSIQKSSFSGISKKELKQKIYDLDDYIEHLANDPEANFLIKSEIYKTILESKHQDKEKYQQLDIKYVEELEERIQDETLKCDSFCIWLIQSLIKEARIVFKSPEFLGVRSNQVSKNVIKTRRILNLLNPWFYHFSNLGPSEFDTSLAEVKKIAFEQIYFAFQTYFNLKGKKVKFNKKLIYFVEKKLKTEKPNNNEIISEIADISVKPNDTEINTTKEKSWTPKAVAIPTPIPLNKESIVAEGESSYPVPIHTPNPAFTPFVPPTPSNDW